MTGRWLVGLGLLALSWAGAFGIALAVVEWRTDDANPPLIEPSSEQETVEPSPQRLLTATEAGALAQRYLSDQRNLFASQFVCQANDYNELRGEWIVLCSATVTTNNNESTIRFTFAVNDQSSETRQLSP